MPRYHLEDYCIMFYVLKHCSKKERPFNAKYGSTEKLNNQFAEMLSQHVQNEGLPNFKNGTKLDMGSIKNVMAAACKDENCVGFDLDRTIALFKVQYNGMNSLEILLSICAKESIIVTELDKIIVTTIKSILEEHLKIPIFANDYNDAAALRLGKDILAVYVDEQVVEEGNLTPAQMKEKKQLKQIQMRDGDKQQIANALSMGRSSNKIPLHEGPHNKQYGYVKALSIEDANDLDNLQVEKMSYTERNVYWDQVSRARSSTIRSRAIAIDDENWQHAAANSAEEGENIHNEGEFFVNSITTSSTQSKSYGEQARTKDEKKRAKEEAQGIAHQKETQDFDDAISTFMGNMAEVGSGDTVYRNEKMQLQREIIEEKKRKREFEERKFDADQRLAERKLEMLGKRGNNN